MKKYPIERIYRDQRILEIFEGTSQVQKIVIAQAMLKPIKQVQEGIRV